MPPAKTAIDATKVRLYEKLVATERKVTLKGATHPYTSANGHMFSFLHPSGSMALRLPDGERQKFIAKFKTGLFEAYGVIQKESVVVPDSLLRNTFELSVYFEVSYGYVQSLKPKPNEPKKIVMAVLTSLRRRALTIANPSSDHGSSCRNSERDQSGGHVSCTVLAGRRTRSLRVWAYSENEV